MAWLAVAFVLVFVIAIPPLVGAPRGSTWTIARLLALSLQGTLLGAAVALWAGVRTTRRLWALAKIRTGRAVLVGLGTCLGLPVVAVIVLATAVFIETEEDPGAATSSIGELVVYLAEEHRETARLDRLMREAGISSSYSFLFEPAAAYAAALHDDCIHALATRKMDEPDSKIDQAARLIVSRTQIPFDEARDLATDKAMEVCTDRTLEGESARQYYWQAIKNAAVDVLRSGHYRRFCPLTPGIERRARARDPFADWQDEFTMRCVKSAQCRMTDRDKALLTLCVEFSAREIEQRSGMSKSTADRRCREVRDRFREVFQRVCE